MSSHIGSIMRTLLSRRSLLFCPQMLCGTLAEGDRKKRQGPGSNVCKSRPGGRPALQCMHARTGGHVGDGGVATAHAVALDEGGLQRAPGAEQARVARGRMQQEGALHQLRPQRVALRAGGARRPFRLARSQSGQAGNILKWLALRAAASPCCQLSLSLSPTCTCRQWSVAAPTQCPQSCQRC